MCPYLPDIQQSSIESFLRAIYLAEKSENSSKIPFISIDPRPETVSQRQMFFLFFPLPRQKSIQSQSSCLLSATSGYSSFLTLCHFLLFSLLELLEQEKHFTFCGGNYRETRKYWRLLKRISYWHKQRFSVGQNFL